IRPAAPGRGLPWLLRSIRSTRRLAVSEAGSRRSAIRGAVRALVPESLPGSGARPALGLRIGDGPGRRERRNASNQTPTAAPRGLGIGGTGGSRGGAAGTPSATVRGAEAPSVTSKPAEGGTIATATVTG